MCRVVSRGGMLLKNRTNLLLQFPGSFDVVLMKVKIKRYSLNRSYIGLLIPPGQWRSMQNFSNNSLALVFGFNVIWPPITLGLILIIYN
jgi:hypothetical protein